MIKIIKQGNPNRRVHKIYKGNCIRCGCEFEFDVNDLEGGFFTQVIKCPCCGLVSPFDQEKREYREEITYDDKTIS